MEKKETLQKYSVFADVNVCCVECFSCEEERSTYRMTLNSKIFDEYIEKYCSNVTYETYASDRVNYHLTKNIYLRKYSFVLKLNQKKYTVYANCEDYCVCCYGNNCKQAISAEKDNEYSDCYEYHDCEEEEDNDKCACNIYYGGKWHVSVSDFYNYYKADSDRDFTKFRNELNYLSYEKIKNKLPEIEPLECVTSILCYKPFLCIGNDK